METLPLVCVYDGVESDPTIYCCYEECVRPAVADFTLDLNGRWCAFVGACSEHMEDLAVFAMVDASE
jgi:hypothetical protein